MSLSEGRMHQLMAYADHELSGAERVEVEALLSESEEARQFIAELGVLGGLVRTGWENRPDAKRVASFDVADAVMKAVGAPPSSATAPPAPSAGVASLDAARQRRVQQRMKIVGVAAALLAAAAAVALVARSPSETPIAKAPPAVSEAPAAPGGGPGIEVEAVESPGSAVSVFYLPGANELSTSVVVWVDETGEK